VWCSLPSYILLNILLVGFLLNVHPRMYMYCTCSRDKSLLITGLPKLGVLIYDDLRFFFLIMFSFFLIGNENLMWFLYWFEILELMFFSFQLCQKHQRLRTRKVKWLPLLKRDICVHMGVLRNTDMDTEINIGHNHVTWYMVFL